MSKAEIRAMKPGPELNRKVAEEVMDHIVVEDPTFDYMERFVIDGKSFWGNVQPYSEDMTAVRSVIQRMIELGYRDVTSWEDFGEGRYTRPEAICKKALLEMLEQRRANDPAERILREAFES